MVQGIIAYFDESLRRAETNQLVVQKDEHIRDDQRDSHDRKRPCWILITQWDHGVEPSISWFAESSIPKFGRRVNRLRK
jgi:hypothetical protein